MHNNACQVSLPTPERSALRLWQLGRKVRHSLCAAYSLSPALPSPLYFLPLLPSRLFYFALFPSPINIVLFSMLLNLSFSVVTDTRMISSRGLSTSHIEQEHAKSREIPHTATLTQHDCFSTQLSNNM